MKGSRIITYFIDGSPETTVTSYDPMMRATNVVQTMAWVSMTPHSLSGLASH
jgi:hypothetical protein